MTTAVATNKLSGKWIGWLTSLLGGLFVAWCFYDPSTPKVNLYWFGTIMAIGMFAFDLLPNFVTAVLLLMYYILTGIAAPDVAFVGWTTPIPWLCMCGMLIGVLMEKTRLANRIALFTISRVGTTPIRMYIAFLLAGFIVSAIIPDVITVDILFMAIATGMCQSLNLSVTSRSATTIVLAAFFGATISSAAYLPNNTGIIGLLMVKDMGVPFTWLGFYSENLPYQIGHALLAYTILHLFGGRELGEHISRCRACAEAELATLGKMSRDEKKTLVLALLALVAFISEPWHGIPGYFAFCSMVLLGFTPIFNLMEASDSQEGAVPHPVLYRGLHGHRHCGGNPRHPRMAGREAGALPPADRQQCRFVHVRLLGGRRRQPCADACRGGNVPERAHGRNRHLAEPWDQAHPVQLPVRA